MKYGYGHVDTYSLDHYFLEVFSRAIKDFREYTCCHPTDITFDEWTKILDEIVEGFEAMRDGQWEVLSDKETKEVNKKYNKAMKLFCKWHRDLWW
jgi:hypothetical protein